MVSFFLGLTVTIFSAILAWTIGAMFTRDTKNNVNLLLGYLILGLLMFFFLELLK